MGEGVVGKLLRSIWRDLKVSCMPLFLALVTPLFAPVKFFSGSAPGIVRLIPWALFLKLQESQSKAAMLQMKWSQFIL